VNLKRFFIVIFHFLLTACSLSQIGAPATLSPSAKLPTLTSVSTAPPSLSSLVTNAPTNTVTPVPTNVVDNIPFRPTLTPLPAIQQDQTFVLTQINMIDENIGWGVEATGHLLRTLDSGSTWKDVTPPEVGFYSTGDTLHAWNTIETQAACESCPGGWVMGLITWRTSDGGETWQQGSFINEGEPDFRPVAMQFVMNTKGWFLFVYQIGMSGFTYESLTQTLDGGESWRLIHPFSNGCVSGGMIFIDEEEGWIGDDCRGLSNALDGIALQDFLKGTAAPSLNRTTDGGNTWNSFPVPAPTVFPSNFTSSEIDPNTWFYCGTKQMDTISQNSFLFQWNCNTAHSPTFAEASYAYLTPDGGQTWYSWLSTGNETFTNPHTGWRLFVANDGQSNSLQQTTDGGTTWITIKSVTWQTAQFDFVSEQVGWAIVSDGMNSALVHTVDGGKTWIEIKPVIVP
jgi:photosystem II stability/assembly factor-like uncharacterized protein